MQAVNFKPNKIIDSRYQDISDFQARLKPNDFQIKSDVFIFDQALLASPGAPSHSDTRNSDTMQVNDAKSEELNLLENKLNRFYQLLERSVRHLENLAIIKQIKKIQYDIKELEAGNALPSHIKEEDLSINTSNEEKLNENKLNKILQPKEIKKEETLPASSIKEGNSSLT